MTGWRFALGTALDRPNLIQIPQKCNIYGFSCSWYRTDLCSYRWILAFGNMHRRKYFVNKEHNPRLSLLHHLPYYLLPALRISHCRYRRPGARDTQTIWYLASHSLTRKGANGWTHLHSSLDALQLDSFRFPNAILSHVRQDAFITINTPRISSLCMLRS